jgi:hypothetical protein
VASDTDSGLKQLGADGIWLLILVILLVCWCNQQFEEPSLNLNALRHKTVHFAESHKPAFYDLVSVVDIFKNGNVFDSRLVNSEM